MRSQVSIENLSIILVVLVIILPLAMMSLLNARLITAEKGLEDVRNFMDFLKSNVEKVIGECPSKKVYTYYLPYKVRDISFIKVDSGILITLETESETFREVAKFNPKLDVYVREDGLSDLSGPTRFEFECYTPSAGFRIFTVKGG